MKKEFTAAALALTLALSLTPVSVLAEYSVKDQTAEVSSFEDFQSAAKDHAVEKIVIGADLEFTADVETGKQIQVAEGVRFSIADGAKITVTAGAGEFSYADLEQGDMENFQRLASSGVNFLKFNGDTETIREMYGSVDNAVEALSERQWTSAVLSGDAVLDKDITVGSLYVLQGGSLTVEKDVTLTVESGLVEGDIILKNGQALPEELKCNGKISAGDPKAPDSSQDSDTAPVSAESGANPAENPFDDVTEDSPFYQAILWAVGKEIATGRTDTTFAPAETCTVANIITFLWRAYDRPSAEHIISEEMSQREYYYTAAQWAANLGMIQSAAELYQPCTRAMAVRFIWMAAGKPDPAHTELAFTDVAADSSDAKAVAWAVEAGITQGTSESAFAPEVVCTRGNIAAFLYRAFHKS